MATKIKARKRPKARSSRVVKIGDAPVGKLTVLDVGHGNSAVLVSGGRTVVVDAGPGSSLLEFLRECRIDEIHEIFVSHADQDHIEGILALLGENIRIHSVRVNTDSLKQSELWNDLLYELEQKRLAGRVCFQVGLTANDPPYTFGSVTVTVLGPSPYLAGKGPGSTDAKGRAISSNSVSAVLRVAVGAERGILFTGDLDGVGLDDLRRSNVSLGADVLVYPHHGGRAAHNDTAFASKLAERVGAKHVIFSIGRAGRNTGNPKPQVVSAIRKALPQARIACTQLSAHCAASTPSDDPTHLLSVFARGRSTRACCAGSLVLNLPLRDVTPVHKRHLAFIKKNARTAMCLGT